MVDYLHVVIKIICAEFEIMVMMETFFLRGISSIFVENISWTLKRWL